MSMTLVITNNVEDRFRGFILSCMPEVSSGLYISTNLNNTIRMRMWETLSDWHHSYQSGSIILIYEDKKSLGGIAIKSLGRTTKKLFDIDGFYVSLKR